MNETTDATSIFAPLWRRKWIILAVAIVVGGLSYAYYKRQRATYESTTQLYLGASVEEAAPGEKTPTHGTATGIANQTAVINTIVLEKVHLELKRLHKGVLARSIVVRARASEKGEFITIATEGHAPKNTAFVANLVATTYIRRQQLEHRTSIEAAISITRRQLRRIEATATTKPASGASGKKTGAGAQSTTSILQAANLNSRINQLESRLAVGGAQQIKPAKPTSAVLLAPKPRKNAIFGFILGLVLAAIGVYLLSRFDRRLRTLAGIEQAFGKPILASLPKVSRPVVKRDGQPAASRQLLEPLRRLHTTLQLGGELAGPLAGPPRAIAFISADPGDGKTAVVADLALTQRDAGQRVALVEANFRRPAQARLLGLDASTGLADVLAGVVPSSEALARVLPLQSAEALATEPAPGGGLATLESQAGALFVLAGSTKVANPPALLAQPVMPELLRELASDFDYVLLDAPSPLEFSDVLPLLKAVDGIIIVARAAHTREFSAHRLRQVLEQTQSASVLGVVANCVTRKDAERFGYASPNGSIWPLKLIGR